MSEARPDLVDAIKRVTIRVDDNGGLDLQCACGAFVRSTFMAHMGLYAALDVIVAHRHECRLNASEG